MSGPIGPDRLDHLFAQLMAVVANTARGKGQPPFRAEQFVPKWDPDAPSTPRPEMSSEEMLRTVRGIHRRMSGEGKRGRSRGDAG